MQYRRGAVKFTGKKCYEGVQFNVISVAWDEKCSPEWVILYNHISLNQGEMSILNGMLTDGTYQHSGKVIHVINCVFYKLLIM